MPKQTIMITGGGGFIGCALSAKLVAQGADIVALDVLLPQVHRSDGRPARLPPSVRLIPFDVTNPVAWDALLKVERPATVIHLAAETGTGQSLNESARHGSVNVVGTCQMVDAFTRAGHTPDHLVLASSRAVYGEGGWLTGDEVYYPTVRTHEVLAQGRWVPESATGSLGTPLPSVAGQTPTAPTNVYAATKLAQEHILQAWCAARGSALSVLRFQNVYGPGQSLGNPYTGVLSIFTRQALSGETINVFEDGSIVRDFVHVEDVATAVGTAIRLPPKSSRLLDIGSGHSSTILEVATLVAELAGAPSPVVSGQFRDGDVRAACCSIDAARTDLGFDPKWNLAEGLGALVANARQELDAS